MLIKSQVGQTVAILLHELLVPLSGLIGVHLVLKDKVPQELVALINILGETSGLFKDEIRDFESRFKNGEDVNSSVKSATQIRQQAARWRKFEKIFSDANNQIQKLRTSVKLEDSSLDNILENILPNRIKLLDRVLNYLETLEAKELFYTNEERLIYFGIYEKNALKQLKKGYPAEIIARMLTYELIKPLNSLIFGYSVLNGMFTQEILASVNTFGETGQKFRDDAIKFAEHFTQEIGLKPDEAAKKIRQQVLAWAMYESQLANAAQHIHEWIALGFSTNDSDLDAVISGALLDAFAHLQRLLKELAMLNSQDF